MQLGRMHLICWLISSIVLYGLVIIVRLLYKEVGLIIMKAGSELNKKMETYLNLSWIGPVRLGLHLK